MKTYVTRSQLQAWDIDSLKLWYNRFYYPDQYHNISAYNYIVAVIGNGK